VSEPRRYSTALRSFQTAVTRRRILGAAERHSGIARDLGERTLPLVMMALAQAAAGDAELRAFAQTIEAERAVGARNVTGHVADWPKPDLTEFHLKLALPSRSPTVGFTWASAILSVGTAPSVSAAGLRSALTLNICLDT
jgi:hypothetical protein